MRRAHLSKNGVVNHGSNYEVQLQSCCNLYPNSLLEIVTLPEGRNTDPLFFSVEVFYVIDFPIYQHVGSILQCCYAISFTLRFFGLNHHSQKKLIKKKRTLLVVPTEDRCHILKMEGVLKQYLSSPNSSVAKKRLLLASQI